MEELSIGNTYCLSIPYIISLPNSSSQKRREALF